MSQVTRVKPVVVVGRIKEITNKHGKKRYKLGSILYKTLAAAWAVHRDHYQPGDFRTEWDRKILGW